jgi:hypothetical protein
MASLVRPEHFQT